MQTIYRHTWTKLFIFFSFKDTFMNFSKIWIIIQKICTTLHLLTTIKITKTIYIQNILSMMIIMLIILILNFIIISLLSLLIPITLHPLKSHHHTTHSITNVYRKTENFLFFRSSFGFFLFVFQFSVFFLRVTFINEGLFYLICCWFYVKEFVGDLIFFSKNSWLFYLNFEFFYKLTSKILFLDFFCKEVLVYFCAFFIFLTVCHINFSVKIFFYRFFFSYFYGLINRHWDFLLIV